MRRIGIAMLIIAATSAGAQWRPATKAETRHELRREHREAARFGWIGDPGYVPSEWDGVSYKEKAAALTDGHGRFQNLIEIKIKSLNRTCQITAADMESRFTKATLLRIDEVIDACRQGSLN